MMDESRYLRLAQDAFKRVVDALEEVDPSDVDLDTAGDVVTLTLKDGIRCVMNTQRPTRQIWLAARARAWHFNFDEASSRWLDDKGTGAELFGTIADVVKQSAGVELKFA